MLSHWPLPLSLLTPYVMTGLSSSMAKRPLQGTFAHRPARPIHPTTLAHKVLLKAGTGQADTVFRSTFSALPRAHEQPTRKHAFKHMRVMLKVTHDLRNIARRT